MVQSAETVLTDVVVLGSNCLQKTAAPKDKDCSKYSLQPSLICCPSVNIVYIDHQYQLLPAGSDLHKGSSEIVRSLAL